MTDDRSSSLKVATSSGSIKFSPPSDAEQASEELASDSTSESSRIDSVDAFLVRFCGGVGEAKTSDLEAAPQRLFHASSFAQYSAAMWVNSSLISLASGL